jgi:hypothetical protein
MKVSLRSWFHLSASLTQLLRERRKVSEGEDDNFNIFDTQQLDETLSSTMRVLTSRLGAVTAVSLPMALAWCSGAFLPSASAA